ncbi:hypothetical protein DUNSADRAFT_18211 [Dunaliella salina]|uniref:Encoded protein n=1 Tax=Dunaliella salina TaxID=3046 RepID=A0ABQ7GZ99_DUNSA|nr:hypothetical protein DUNSADRAFT_18211 [Dunaliella salina]|eukprot:KAF5839930.1 hypothetical protein DUNSADRAFT_18211 [Dunaliella salina]
MQVLWSVAVAKPENFWWSVVRRLEMQTQRHDRSLAVILLIIHSVCSSILVCRMSTMLLTDPSLMDSMTARGHVPFKQYERSKTCHVESMFRLRYYNKHGAREEIVWGGHLASNAICRSLAQGPTQPATHFPRPQR